VPVFPGIDQQRLLKAFSHGITVTLTLWCSHPQEGLSERI
jgi:hypothetical protein